MAMKPDAVTNQSDEFQCVKRGVELSVEGCLTSRAAKMPACKGCEVGAAMKERFTSSKTVEGPRVKTPPPPRAPAARPVPLRVALPMAPPATPAPATKTGPWRAAVSTLPPPAKQPVVPNLRVPPSLPPPPLASAPWREGDDRLFVPLDLGAKASVLVVVPDLEPLPARARPVASAPWRAEELAAPPPRPPAAVIEDAPPASAPVAFEASGPFKALEENGLLPEAQEIADRHRVKLAVMIGRGNDLSVVAARAEFAWVLRQRHKKSFPEIGKLLDGRDHTSIMSLVKRFQVPSPEAAAPAGAVLQ